jgi:hypothetical protein
MNRTVNALKQSQIRDIIEMSVRNKRQRLATEELHKLARKENVEIVIDAVAQPAQVSWKEDWYREYHNMYVIFSKDGTIVFGFDMTNGRMLKMKTADYLDLKVEKMTNLIGNANKVPVFLEMGIPEMENPDGSSAKCARLNYKFGAWYVLEILENGHFFYVQRKMTAKLQEYADEIGLLYSTEQDDKFTSRAKLATVDGKNYWSLRCERDGKPCFLLLSEDETQFTVTEVAPKIWVLQQPVALKLVTRHAKANNLAVQKVLPYVAMGNGHNVWAVPLVSGGYLVCRIRTGEVSFAENVTDSLKGKMTGEAFDCTLCGFEFRPTAWYEAEYVQPE